MKALIRKIGRNEHRVTMEGDEGELIGVKVVLNAVGYATIKDKDKLVAIVDNVDLRILVEQFEQRNVEVTQCK